MTIRIKRKPRKAIGSGAKPTFHAGEAVSWGYRGTRGHGTVQGVHKMAATSDAIEYAIKEHDHHVSAKGSREPSVVYHKASDMAHEG